MPLFSPKQAARAALCAALTVAAGCAPGAPRSAEAPISPIAGVTTLERAPAGGLRYRLYMADRAPATPVRLVVWLHPSGGSFNRAVALLAKDIVRRGFALLVPVDKQYELWAGSEANQLMNRTVPDAGTVPGVDTDRPILMGYSAGANMALNLWAAAPGYFGGLILDCAAPRFMKGPLLVSRPAPSPLLRETPILLLIGEHDRAAPAWHREIPSWVAAGVPLTARFVAGAGHTYLLRAPLLDTVYTWLEARRDDPR